MYRKSFMVLCFEKNKIVPIQTSGYALGHGFACTRDPYSNRLWRLTHIRTGMSDGKTYYKLREVQNVIQCNPEYVQKLICRSELFNSWEESVAKQEVKKHDNN